MKPVIIKPSAGFVRLLSNQSVEIESNNAYIQFETMNTTFIFKRGSRGTVMRFVLADETGKVNLNDCTVTMTARRQIGETAVLDNVACAVGTNQFEQPGEASFTFTDTHARIPRGNYLLEFKVVKNDSVRYFPSNAKTLFAELVVREPLN